MPVEFRLEPMGSSSDTLFKLTMAYDGSGRRISKTVMRKAAGAADWDTAQVTHYTGIGTEIREDLSKNQTKVVVNMPEGFGRYGVEDASKMESAGSAGEIPMMNFEWYLKNHLGSTMLVYGTQGDVTHYKADFSKPKAAYDYRAFGEMLELTPPATGKVTENFTGKELDDEIALNYFGARYLDPMLALWISVDPKRQYYNSYLYANNNPVVRVDPDGNQDGLAAMIRGQFFREQQINTVAAAKSVPSAMGPFVKNSVVNAANRVGSAMKETILFVEPAVTVAEFGIPIACALMGAPVSAGLLVAFAGYNAVNSGLKYGIGGSFSSLIIDGTFAIVGSKFAPGARITNALAGGSLKRAADNTLQNILNFGSHELDGLLRQSPNDDFVNMDVVPEKSSSIAPVEDNN